MTISDEVNYLITKYCASILVEICIIFAVSIVKLQLFYIPNEFFVTLMWSKIEGLFWGDFEEYLEIEGYNKRGHDWFML